MALGAGMTHANRKEAGLTRPARPGSTMGTPDTFPAPVDTLIAEDDVLTRKALCPPPEREGDRGAEARRVPRPEPEQVSGLTKAAAEELLDRLEDAGCTHLEVSCADNGFTIRYHRPTASQPGTR
jgi:hypothetical protein